MERSDYLAALQRDGAAFANSISSAGLDARVPSCPDWATADLVRHLTLVHYFWGTIVQQRAGAPDSVPMPESVADDELLAEYDRQFNALVDALTATDSSTPVWTWSSEHEVAFILRRMAHETAV